MPQPPPGGCFIVELTPGFVNGSFIGNTLSLADRESNGIALGGDTFGTTIIGNQISYSSRPIEPATPFPRWRSASAGLGTSPTSNPPGSVHGIPQDWTAMPSLGTIIEGNTLRDSLGIDVGVGHFIVYYSAAKESPHSTRAGCTTRPRSSAIPSNGLDPAVVVEDGFRHLDAGKHGQRVAIPADDHRGRDASVRAAGAYGAPGPTRATPGPWAATTPSGPTTRSTLLQTFRSSSIPWKTRSRFKATSRTPSQAARPSSGQSPRARSMRARSTAAWSRRPWRTFVYNGNQYYPFNVDDFPQYAGNDLNITGQTSAPQTPRVLMLGQDGYDLTGPGTGTPAPDGIQDLHLQLTGLAPGATIASIQVIGKAASGEDWMWPQTRNDDQMVVYHAAGSTTADLFLATTISHLNDTFTLRLTYTTGGTISLAVPGVLFNPRLAVMPGAPPAPVNFSAASASSGPINLAWNATPGATRYTVERSTDKTTWTALSTGVTALTYADTSGLVSGTTYYYRIDATSGMGASSPFSGIASAVDIVAAKATSPTEGGSPTQSVGVTQQPKPVRLRRSARRHAQVKQRLENRRNELQRQRELRLQRIAYLLDLKRRAKSR